jgi:hypothetical protein
MPYEAEAVIQGRIEYYLEHALDVSAEDTHKFALEMLATTMLDRSKVQQMLDRALDEDAVSDRLTVLIDDKIREIKAAHEKYWRPKNA